jgi:phosphoribosylglycinamide formyltransferase-1
MHEIDAYAPDVVVLAGYMRIQPGVRRTLRRSPEYPPFPAAKYPGLHTHRQVLENGDEEHGTSVHFVTDELDGGPVILQAKCRSLTATAKKMSRPRSDSGTCHLPAGGELVCRWSSGMRKTGLAGWRLPPQGYAAEY